MIPDHPFSETLSHSQGRSSTRIDLTRASACLAEPTEMSTVDMAASGTRASPPPGHKQPGTDWSNVDPALRVRVRARRLRRRQQHLTQDQVSKREDHDRQLALSRRSYSGQTRTSGAATEFAIGTGPICKFLFSDAQRRPRHGEPAHRPREAGRANGSCYRIYPRLFA